MTQKTEEKQALYALQEAVLARLLALPDSQLAVAKLCGGTALARCWLDHRMSYDLDFFFPHGFKAADLALSLKQGGIVYEATDLVDDPRKANQLHGYVTHEGRQLKVSFVEDAYFQLFPTVVKSFGSLAVRTEDVAGLYHRKLRTVAGNTDAGDSFAGGRQTARDLFDLYVLTQTHMPIKAFIASLPYAFPSAAFDNGLANMPWFDLMDELVEINCDARWEQAKDIAHLQNTLYEQIGAAIVSDEWRFDSKEA